jgi:CHAT domain-containing protein
MRRFYRALFRDGLRPSAALRQAQIEMLGERVWRGPVDWAAFVLQGDWSAKVL